MVILFRNSILIIWLTIVVNSFGQQSINSYINGQWTKENEVEPENHYFSFKVDSNSTEVCICLYGGLRFVKITKYWENNVLFVKAQDPLDRSFYYFQFSITDEKRLKVIEKGKSTYYKKVSDKFETNCSAN